MSDQGRLSRGKKQNYFLAIFSVLWFICLSSFSQGTAQEARKVQGLERGARDSMRLDTRMTGEKEKIQSGRIKDQMVGSAEKQLRKEMREEESIRSREQSRSNRARMKAQQEETKKRRKHEDEWFSEKKRKVEFGLAIN